MHRSSLTPNANPEAIAQAWRGINEAKPGIRIREAAAELGLSEAQLLATQVGEGVTRLRNEWGPLLKRLPQLGPVMSLTRNQHCILEHKGVFEKVKVFARSNHQMALVQGPIETRVFLKSWHVAFAVTQTKGDRVLTSLQIFDHEGQAITKVYLQEESDYEAYEQLVMDFKAENQAKAQDVVAYEPETYVQEVNESAFLESWSNLQDTHDFFPMLRDYQVQRHQALRLAEGKFSYTIPADSIQPMLEEAARQKLPIMVFAGNRGNLQIHQDTVRTIRLLERGHTGIERWLNVLDPHFNMHLRIDEVASAWVVTKPTKDGDVTAIECYDDQEELVVQFFGLRKPGIAEQTEWKALVDSLGSAAPVS